MQTGSTAAFTALAKLGFVAGSCFLWDSSRAVPWLLPALPPRGQSRQREAREPQPQRRSGRGPAPSPLTPLSQRSIFLFQTTWARWAPRGIGVAAVIAAAAGTAACLFGRRDHGGAVTFPQLRGLQLPPAEAGAGHAEREAGENPPDPGQGGGSRPQRYLPAQGAAGWA